MQVRLEEEGLGYKVLKSANGSARNIQVGRRSQAVALRCLEWGWLLSWAVARWRQQQGLSSQPQPQIHSSFQAAHKWSTIAPQLTHFAAAPVAAAPPCGGPATYTLSAACLPTAPSRPPTCSCLQAFQHDDSVVVLLCTYRAAGVGLNLTAASHVVLLEPVVDPSFIAQVGALLPCCVPSWFAEV